MEDDFKLKKDTKIDYRVFRGDAVSFNLIITMSGSEAYPSFTTRKTDKGWYVEYVPFKGFSIRIKNKNHNDQAVFDIVDIYDFIDAYNIVYDSLKKDEMFFNEPGRGPIVNEVKSKKYTLFFKGKFNTDVIIRPGMVRIWNDVDKSFVDTEGIEFIINNSTISGISHKQARKLKKLLNKTDWLTLCEAVISNTWRQK